MTQWLSVDDCRQIAPVSRSVIYDLSRRRLITTTRVGRRVLVSAESFNEYLATHTRHCRPVLAHPEPVVVRQTRGARRY
jgi:hypothetical protein